MLKSIYLLIGLFFIVSFISDEQLLIGNWTYCYTKNGATVYKKEESLNYKEAGMQFSPNGNLTVLRNETNCGTPPISYGRYNGEWTLSKDSIIYVNYSYQRESVQQKWKLISVNADSLILKR